MITRAISFKRILLGLIYLSYFTISTSFNWGWLAKLYVVHSPSNRSPCPELMVRAPQEPWKLNFLSVLRGCLFTYEICSVFRRFYCCHSYSKSHCYLKRWPESRKTNTNKGSIRTSQCRINLMQPLIVEKTNWKRDHLYQRLDKNA